MEPLQIVANREGYQIFDYDRKQTVVSGIRSVRGAWAIYERLVSLKEAIGRHAKDAEQPPLNRATAP
ncbi:MAG: hypothetical protein HQL88_01960 [Magnetococcales bacterium]|nr:hypothetical protein [Magnetococcales bacterium]